MALFLGLEKTRVIFDGCYRIDRGLWCFLQRRFGKWSNYTTAMNYWSRNTFLTR